MDKSERLDRIEELFIATVNKTADDRQAFLQSVDEKDRDLIGDVLELLAAHDHANVLLDSPTLPAAKRNLNETSTRPANFMTQGASLGGYRIVALLGRGGMGEVYLAEDTRLRRKVALKILPPNLSSHSERLRRFKREAYAISGLNHPNIITIFEIGESEGVHYLVTEYIQGKTLREICREGRPGPQTAIEIVTQVASALGAAHAEGVIHRDIKPENIMVRPDGLVKVLDFGLAKLELQEKEQVSGEASSRSSGESLPGVIVGTPTYMSPEQAAGNPVDARSDLFSLGVVTYEMLMGEAPFRGSTAAEILSAVLKSTPVPIREAVPAPPPSLDHIVARMLNKDVAKRYQSAAELVEDLHRARTQRGEEPSVIQESRARDLTTPEYVTRASTSFVPRVIDQPNEPSSRLSLFLSRTTKSMVRSVREHRVLSAGIGLVLLMALSIPLWRRESIDSLAVLPITNGTGDPNVEYLSDGLTENLINSLSQVSGISVTSRTSAFQFKGGSHDPASIADRLNVDALLLGRLEKVHSSLVLSLELINPGNGRQIWGRRYDGASVGENFSVLLGQIVLEITRKVGSDSGNQTVQQGTSRPASNAEAYTLFLLGQNLSYIKRNDRDGLLNSVKYFRLAIDKDRTYAPAYAGLSLAYSRLGVLFLPPTEMFPQASFYGQRAKELDPTLAEGHIALATVAYRYDWNWEETERELQEALLYKPSSVEALTLYCNLLWTLKRPDEALKHARHALMLDPTSILANVTLGTAFYFVESFEEGDAQYRRILEMDSGYVDSYRAFAWTYEHQGKPEKAAEQLDIALKLSPGDPAVLASLGRVYAQQNRRAEALEKINEMRVVARTRYVSPAWFAEVYAELGDIDQAMNELDKAYSGHCAYLPLIADPHTFKPIRKDERFVNFLKRLNIPS